MGKSCEGAGACAPAQAAKSRERGDRVVAMMMSAEVVVLLVVAPVILAAVTVTALERL